MKSDSGRRWDFTRSVCKTREKHPVLSQRQVLILCASRPLSRPHEEWVNTVPNLSDTTVRLIDEKPRVPSLDATPTLSFTGNFARVPSPFRGLGYASAQLEALHGIQVATGSGRSESLTTSPSDSESL